MRDLLRRIRANPWADLAITIVTAAVIAYLFQLWIAKPFVVPSPSMEPTLREGDRPFAVRFLYHFTNPKRGDILIFHPNGKGNQQFRPPPGQKSWSEPYFVKRLVGMPNEVIGSAQGNVYVCSDGTFPTDPEHPTDTRACRFLKEPYVHGKKSFSSDGQTDFGPEKIPPGYYYMMGDNRTLSDDSRYWGPIPASQIVGRVFMIYWPLTRIRFFL
jgi:signal peptidase I